MRRLGLLILLVTLAACQPAPTPTQTLPLFYDDFGQNRGLWELFNEDGATSQIANGQLSISITEPHTVAFSISALNISDFELTIQTSVAGGGLTNSYGLVFRYVDNRNFYRLDLTGDGLWGVSRRLNDQWISIVELKASPAIQTGLNKPNMIKILGRSGSFMFYANGTLLGAINDNNLPVGRIGVFASTFDDATAQVSFDEISVTKP